MCLFFAILKIVSFFKSDCHCGGKKPGKPQEKLTGILKLLQNVPMWAGPVLTSTARVRGNWVIVLCWHSNKLSHKGLQKTGYMRLYNLIIFDENDSLDLLSVTHGGQRPECFEHHASLFIGFFGTEATLFITIPFKALYNEAGWIQV